MVLHRRRGAIYPADPRRGDPARDWSDLDPRRRLAAGSLATSRTGSSVTRLRRWLAAGLALQGIGMIGSAAAPHLAWAVITFAVTGAGNALLSGPEVRLFQELVGDRLLGRAFGVRSMLGNLAYVLASLSAGAVLATLGVRAGDVIPAVAEPA